MYINMPALIAAFVATGSIFSGFAFNPEHSAEANSDIKLDDAPGSKSNIIEDYKEEAAARLNVDDMTKAAFLHKKDTAGRALAEVKPADPSEASKISLAAAEAAGPAQAAEALVAKTSLLAQESVEAAEPVQAASASVAKTSSLAQESAEAAEAVQVAKALVAKTSSLTQESAEAAEAVQVAKASVGKTSSLAQESAEVVVTLLVSDLFYASRTRAEKLQLLEDQIRQNQIKHYHATPATFFKGNMTKATPGRLLREIRFRKAQTSSHVQVILLLLKKQELDWGKIKETRQEMLSDLKLIETLGNCALLQGETSYKVGLPSFKRLEKALEDFEGDFEGDFKGPGQEDQIKKKLKRQLARFAADDYKANYLAGLLKAQGEQTVNVKEIQEMLLLPKNQKKDWVFIQNRVSQFVTSVKTMEAAENNQRLTDLHTVGLAKFKKLKEEFENAANIDHSHKDGQQHVKEQFENELIPRLAEFLVAVQEEETHAWVQISNDVEEIQAELEKTSWATIFSRIEKLEIRLEIAIAHIENRVPLHGAIDRTTLMPDKALDATVVRASNESTKPQEENSYKVDVAKFEELQKGLQKALANIGSQDQNESYSIMLWQKAQLKATFQKFQSADQEIAKNVERVAAATDKAIVETNMGPIVDRKESIAETKENKKKKKKKKSKKQGIDATNGVVAVAEKEEQEEEEEEEKPIAEGKKRSGFRLKGTLAKNGAIPLSVAFGAVVVALVIEGANLF